MFVDKFFGLIVFILFMFYSVFLIYYLHMIQQVIKGLGNVIRRAGQLVQAGVIPAHVLAGWHTTVHWLGHVTCWFHQLILAVRVSYRRGYDL